jgi:MerR family transcriptional regulator, light-induced transcriptional regulator
MDELLTTRQVAEALQVSESSIKRWCDQGLIRTRRTAGGHRRVGRDDLRAFLASGGDGQIVQADPVVARPAVDAENGSPVGNMGAPDLPPLLPISGLADPESPPEVVRDAFRVALVSGNERLARQLLKQWRGFHDSVARLGDELVSETFMQIGQLWECGRVEVFEERRSCEICGRLLMELRAGIPEPPSGAPRAIGGALSGDHYTLPGQLVEMTLREVGWDATNLGGNLPFRTLRAAIEQEQPRLFWISVSHVDDPNQFVADYRSFYETLPRSVSLVVGGRALTDEVRRKITYTAHCDNLQQLSAFSRAIHAVP